jgi:hypothetical protein
VFVELTTVSGDRVLAHIQQLAEQEGPLADAAATYLDKRGPITHEQIAVKSAQWRKDRKGRDLKWLYFRHIEPKTPKDSGIEEIRKLLGAPSKHGDGFCEWTSTDSPVHMIYLETDKSGKLDWMRFYVNNDAI